MDYRDCLMHALHEEKKKLFYLEYIKNHLPMTEDSLDFYENEIENSKFKIDSFEYFLEHS